MYNQPFSQPPGMFGAQSAMAQMQSAPSLPAGNPSAREYFNYSMATLSNAAMPQAMMPQGISSLVPQYQFGGGIGYSGDVDIDWGGVAAAMDAAQAQADAAAADAANGGSDPGSDPGYDPGTSYEQVPPHQVGLAPALIPAMIPAQATEQVPPHQVGLAPALIPAMIPAQAGTGAAAAPDPGTSNAAMQALSGINQTSIGGIFSPTSVDPAVIAAAQSIDRSLSDAEDEQMQERASDLNDLMSQMQAEAARGTFSRDDAASLFQAQQEAQQALSGINQTNINRSYYNPYAYGIAMGSPIGPITYDPIFGDYHGLSKYGPVVARDPSGNALYGETVFANLPFGLGQVARGIMGRGDNTFGEFPGDVVSTPPWRSQEETDEIIRRSTPPDTGDPDLGDPQQAAPAVAPAYVPPVYQTYAGLGLPSISPIPPLRRVTVPISSFVV
jgi:hypothetical protein